MVPPQAYKPQNVGFLEHLKTHNCIWSHKHLAGMKENSHCPVQSEDPGAGPPSPPTLSAQLLLITSESCFPISSGLMCFCLPQSKTILYCGSAKLSAQDNPCLLPPIGDENAMPSTTTPGHQQLRRTELEES